MIVSDASTVVEGLLDANANLELTALISGAGEPLAAPDLLDFDALSARRR